MANALHPTRYQQIRRRHNSLGRCSRKIINSILKTYAHSSLVQLPYFLWKGAKFSGIWRKYILGNGQASCMDVFVWKICRILGICEDLAAICDYCANFSMFVDIFVARDVKLQIFVNYCIN